MPETTQQSAPATSAPKKGLPKVAKILIGVFAGLIVLAGIGVGALFLVVNSATQAPLNASNKFFDNLQANEPTAAYQLTSDAFKKSVSEDRLTSLFTQVSALMTGEEKITAKKVQSNNGANTAVVTYSVENGGKTRYARITLKEVDSKWQVYGFKTSESPIEAIIE